MKTFSLYTKWGKASMAIVCLLFFTQISAFAGIDLELSISTSNQNPSQYSNISVTTTITNSGSETATGVALEVPISNLSQIVYSGGNEFTASQGSFYPYGTEIWEVGDLSPGASATLTTNYFVLEETQYEIYSQVLNANEDDADSAPNNGTPPNPNEDDEAVLIFNNNGTCSVSASISNIVCNDAGTPNDPTDDTFDFSFIISGTNNADIYDLSGDLPQTLTLDYGTTYTFTDYPISGGDLNFMVTDFDDPDCQTTFTVTAPSLCSNGNNCDLSFMGIDAVCDDNGTPNDPNDDQWFAHINPTGTGLGTTFSITGNITANNLPYGQNHIFGPYPIDPFLNIAFTITDDEFGCTESFILVNGSACSTGTQCQISAETLSVECSQEGTPNDPSDDTWGFVLNVTGDNNSNNWIWELPGGNATLTGIYDQPTLYTNQPLTGPETLQIDIHDAADVNCTTSVTVNAPFPCVVNDLPDVELTMNSTSTGGAFVFVSFDIQVTNTGNANASGLIIRVPLPDDAIPQGGNEFSATAGIVGGFNTWTWQFGVLAPGQTETLTVNYFTLTDTPITGYAQVVAMIGDDEDSTPLNGTPPIPNEDDEAAFTIGGMQNLPDLTISNLVQNLPSSLELETDYPISFDLNNIGTSIAAGDFRIGMYLSLDENFDSGSDILVGEVLTGNIANTTPINAAIRVEDTTPSQDYFLIIVADDLQHITELDENNNVLSTSNTFAVFNINDGCTGVFVATNQAELDQFPQGCTTWAGSLELNGDITDLSPLSNLDTILGNLIFEECTVTDFSPLAGLEEAGTLFFYFNPNMTSLNGFPTSISTRSIQVIGNPNLENLDGMPTVTTQLDNLTIANNASLASLDGLSGISGNHPDMVLVVDLNPQLSSLSGLENITQIDRIISSGNDILSECCAVFELLNTNSYNDAFIQDNEIGCNSVADILSSCTNSGTGCAFENIYPPHPISLIQQRQKAIETIDGFEIETFGRVGGQTVYYDLSIDIEGNEISNTVTALPVDIFRRTNDGNFIFYDSPIDSELRIVKTDGTGGTIWENTFIFDFGPGQSPPLVQDMVETSDGLAFIVLVYSGGANLHLLKVDNLGNEIVNNNFLTVSNFTFINSFEEADNGDFFAFYQGNGSNYIRIDANGTLVYDKSVGSPDFPSYDYGDFAESIGGQFIYTTYVNFDLNSGIQLIKFDALTGNNVSTVQINDVLSPNSTYFGQLPRKILATTDGGVALGYETSEAGMSLGWEFGQIDANGNEVWSNHIIGSYNLEPILQTLDGGFLFAGKINNEFGIIKTTSLGKLSPICEPTSCEITVTILDIQCQNQSTLDDATDDTFSARILVEGSSECQGNFLIDGQFGGIFGGQGIFGEQAVLGSYPISDGNAIIEVTDVNGENGVMVTLEAPNACSSGANPDECGFENTYPPIPEFSNLITQKAVETSDGYDLEMFGNAVGAPLFVYYDLSTDFAGTELSNSQTILPVNGFKRVESGNFYAMENVSNTKMRLRRLDNTGTTLWENVFTFDSGAPQGIPEARDVIEVSDGIVFLVSANGPTDNSWLLKTDFDGNVIYNKHFQEEDGFLEYRFVGEAQNGDFLIYRHSSSRTGFLIRATGGGDLIYQESIVGDLVTSRVGGFAETADGNFVYAAYRNQLTPELEKLDALTGETIWKINLSNTLSPNLDPINSFDGGSVIATADGGAVVSYAFNFQFTNDIGFEYGRLSASGLLDWWQHLPDGYDLDAELETSDGGFLFAGSINDVFGIVKTTSEGFLTPTCVDNSVNADLSLSLNTDPTIVSSGIVLHTLTITNEGQDDATNVSVQFYQGNSFTQTAQSVTAGNYDNSNDLWTIGLVVAGTSETLILEEFFVDFEFSPTSSISFFEVLTSNENDSDSTPGNDNGDKTADEDDEAIVEIFPKGTILPYDLSVVLETSQNTVNVGETVTFDFVIQSDQNWAVEGVIAQLDIPSSLQLDNFSVSQGSFDPNTGQWNAGYFLPLQSETLTIEATLLDDSQVTNVFGQIQSTDNTVLDFDSEPGNGNCCQPNEDDEAVLKIQTDGSISKPDLFVNNIVLDINPLGTDLDISFNLNNIGLVPVNNHVRTRLLISEDQVLSPDDELLGLTFLLTEPIVQSGFFSFATVNVPFPNTLAPGDYSLIVVTDYEEEVIEANENNNQTIIPFNIPDPLGIDLELSMTASTLTPTPFSFMSATLELSNVGSKNGTGIVVDFPLPDEFTFQGGNEYTASQGTYSVYGNQQWNIGNLNAGETVTLTVNYFILANNKQIDLYAQVVAQDPLERDSEPNNGTPPTVNEDDEATLSVFVSSQNALGSAEGFTFNAFASGDFITEIIWTHNKGEEVENYVLEHSTDGVNFAKLSSRISNEVNTYQLFEEYDLNPITGDNFYRIRLEKRDGSIEFSEIQLVHFADLIDFSLFPNPANKFVKVNLEDILGFENVKIEIYNNLGILVLEKEISKVNAQYNQLDLREIHEGFYTVYLKIPSRKPIAKSLMIGKI